MIKWVEIAGQNSKLRYDFLSRFLNEKGYKNQLDYVTADLDSFPEKLQELMQNYDHIRVGSPFGEKVYEQVPKIPVTTMIQKSADSMVKQGNEWWARSMLTEGLTREMALLKKVDISETAFIIGAGASCRAIVAALLKAGFKKFNIADKFEERGRLLVKDLQSTYFGVDFRFTPAGSVTLLPGIHSLVVNSSPFVVSNDILSELYYCNFLKPNGVVIDLTIVPVETPLLKSVQQVEGRVVPGYKVASLVDVYWVRISMGIQLNEEEYTESFHQYCLSQPFDFTGFDIPEF